MPLCAIQELPEQFFVYYFAIIRESIDQIELIQNIDQPRNAAGSFVYQFTNPVREYLPGSTRDRQTVVDILRDLVLGQRPQVEVRTDTLRKLRQFWQRELVPQLRLPNQYHLQKFVFIGIDVGKHTQLFQRFNGQFLRFVDDQQHAPAARIAVDQIILELPESLT